MAVSDYSTTAASNTSIGGIGIEGTSSISNFDNALRQLMADIASGIAAGSFTATGYVSKSAGYTVATSDRGKIIDCTAALELDLPAAATAGAGFVFIVKANGGAVTVDPNSTENINGASTSLTVANGTSAIVACTGSAWHSITIDSGSGKMATASYPTLVSLEGLSLAEGDILYATAADTLARLAKGTADQVLTMNDGATAPEWTTPSAGVSAASQAEQETASSTSVYVTPGRQHFHPSAAKFWAVVTYSAGTPTLAASYNVTSITDTGLGRLTATIATDFSSANWCCQVALKAQVDTTDGSTGSVFENYTAQVVSIAAGTVEINTLRWDIDDGGDPTDQSISLRDPEAIYITGFGDHA